MAEPIYVSDSSDDEKSKENTMTKALEEAKEYVQKNPRTKIMEDTIKRLANFACTVEQFHEEQSEDKESDYDKERRRNASEESSESESKPKKKNKQKTLVSSIKKTNRSANSRSTTPEKEVTIQKAPNPLDDDPIEPIIEDEDIHKDNCVKIVSEIYRYFEGKYPKISIIIALHKNCGKIYDAMISLENGEIEKDPKLLVDPSIVKGSEEDKRRYFCN